MHANFFFRVLTHLEMETWLCFKLDSVSKHSNCYFSDFEFSDTTQTISENSQVVEAQLKFGFVARTFWVMKANFVLGFRSI